MRNKKISVGRESENERNKTLLLKHLQCAREVFATAGHSVLSLEAWHLSALVFNLFGMTEERNEAAKQFCNLQKKIAN